MPEATWSIPDSHFVVVSGHMTGPGYLERRRSGWTVAPGALRNSGELQLTVGGPDHPDR